MEAKVSIIVPIYNVESYVERCIQSLLAQTLEEIEIILIEDGSPDRSGEICDRYEAKDKRIRVIHQENLGVSMARNRGVSIAKGEYIGFVDPDDFVTEDMYERLYGAIKQYEADIAVCRMQKVENNRQLSSIEESETKKPLILNHTEALRELFKGRLYRFSLCNKLFSRSCFKEVSFPKGRGYEDLSTSYKLFSNAQNTVYIDFIGYIYIRRENSALHSPYSEKKLQAFIGWKEIIEFMNVHYHALMQEVIACFSFWVMDTIYIILKEVNEKKKQEKFLRSIQMEVKNYKYDIEHNHILSWRTKLVMIAFCFLPKLVMFYGRLRKNY